VAFFLPGRAKDLLAPLYFPTQQNTNGPKIGYIKLYDVTVQHSIAQRSVRTAEAERDSCQGMRKLHFTPRWYIWVVRLLTSPLRAALLPLRPTVTRASALQNSANHNVMCIQYVVKHNLVPDGMLIY